MSLHWLRSLLLITLTLATGFVTDDPTNKTVKLADCPAAVRKTIDTELKGVKIESVNQQTLNDETEYWVKAALHGRDYEIRVDQEGTLMELALVVPEDVIKFSNAPAPVQATLKKESGGATFTELEKDLKYGVTVYHGVSTIAGKDYAFLVAENGTLIEKTLVIAEDDIDLSHCPTAVQKAIKDHAQAGKIGHITRSTGIGGHVYEANLEITGKNYFLEVTEGGTLISKALVEADE